MASLHTAAAALEAAGEGGVLVEVQTSKLPGAGLGVFALQDVEAGTVLTQYRGEAEPPEARPPGGMITLDVLAERNLARAREYSLELGDGRTLVGSEDYTDPARAGQVVNDAGCITAAAALQGGAPGALEGYIDAVANGANARLEVGGQRAYAVAARPIKAGEEILTAYSSPWWLAKVGPELQWRARRAAANRDPAGAEAAWELLEDLEMASEMYAALELEVLRGAGVFQGGAGDARLEPFRRPASPELDGQAPLADRLAMASTQWNTTSIPLRRRLVEKYGLEG